MQPFAFHIND